MAMCAPLRPHGSHIILHLPVLVGSRNCAAVAPTWYLPVLKVVRVNTAGEVLEMKPAGNSSEQLVARAAKGRQAGLRTVPAVVVERLLLQLLAASSKFSGCLSACFSDWRPTVTGMDLHAALTD